MTDKRYQVFISSTYEDLKNERKAVHEAILQAGDFPVGMEAFPAADDEQFEFIKPIIDKSDYYLVFVGGRYGSIADDGLSYTEKEYRYAKSKGIPILAIVHEDITTIPVGKSEASDNGQQKLVKFITELSTDRMTTKWNNVDNLRHKVQLALDHAKSTKPRPGWVRGDTVASFELLTEVNELRKRNDALQTLVEQDAIGVPQLDVLLPDLPSLSDVIEIDIYQQNRLSVSGIVKGTWLDFFPIFYDSMIASWFFDSDFDQGRRYDEELFTRSFADRLCMMAYSCARPYLYISNRDQTALVSYYHEAGFMMPDGPIPFGDRARQVHRRLAINSKTVTGKITSVGSAEFGNLEDKVEEIPF